VVRAEYDVNLNPITPAGEYKIEVGLLSGGNPLAVVIDGRAVSDRLIFGSIEILPSDRFGNH
jgi:hypothetical protein